MESMPINWEALDSLVLDFAKSEHLIEEDSTTTTTTLPASSSSTSSSSSSPSSPSSSSSSSSSSPSSPSSSSYRYRLLIRQIRRSLESGDVDAAIDLLRIHAPFILQDHRLLFRLQKQKFIELLRRGSRASAIQCLRNALAPCALDAYPEAYEEFKHVLLALVFNKDDQTSPVAHEWSERRRFDIAGLLSYVLRAHLHAYDPIFTMTLRYLISIHKGFCFRQGISSPISDLTERLLLEERDPSSPPQESLFEAPPFDEVDVQALAHAVDLTRQGAIDSLRFAKGDLLQAFKNELGRMKLDGAVLDEFVHEYCVYRGMVEGGLLSPEKVQGPGESSSANIPDPGNGTINMDCTPSKDSHGEISFINPDVDGAQELNTQGTGIQGNDVELRFAYEITGTSEQCSTSGPENCRRFRRSRGNGTGEKSGRKRWRGRNEELDIPLSRSSKQGAPSAQVTESNTLEEHQVSVKRFANNKESYDYEVVLEMKELASKGMAAEVVEEVNSMDVNFFVQNPVLLFQLKRVEFLKLLSCSDQSGALRVATSYLGPLAATDPTLLKSLKETLMAFLRPDEDALARGIPLSVLATSLQVALGRSLGIEEPQLMKIVRETLHTHNEWFKIQMCKDPFEGLLKIDSLKEINNSSLIDAASKTAADMCTSGSSQVTISSGSRIQEDGSSPTQVSSRDLLCDETAILKVMEFLALPRADAIHLLAQYNGNAETVIQQIFA